mmetsp:Transcript_17796/g.53422  ORF Transcript_17796/g.53422 Transcript_17796/m.53422 type:complete len:291 (+) Transcript_17796:810-1682(+)
MCIIRSFSLGDHGKLSRDETIQKPTSYACHVEQPLSRIGYCWFDIAHILCDHKFVLTEYSYGASLRSGASLLGVSHTLLYSPGTLPGFGESVYLSKMGQYGAYGSHHDHRSLHGRCASSDRRGSTSSLSYATPHSRHQTSRVLPALAQSTAHQLCSSSQTSTGGQLIGLDLSLRFVFETCHEKCICGDESCSLVGRAPGGRCVSGYLDRLGDGVRRQQRCSHDCGLGALVHPGHSSLWQDLSCGRRALQQARAARDAAQDRHREQGPPGDPAREGIAQGGDDPHGRAALR